MSQAPRLGRAGVLTGLLSVIALACSSDIVELLPLAGGASNGGAGGSAGQDAVPSSGASTGGSNAGGSPTSQGGLAGATQAGGGNGGAAGGGCFGFGCAGENGFSGSFGGPNCGNGSCTPCLNDAQCPLEQHCSALLNNVCVQCSIKGPSQCKPNYNCDVLVGRCAPGCDSTFECNDDRVCDLNQGTCVSCIDNRECEQDGDPRTSVCYQRRCVECAQHSDCTKQGGEQRWCSKLQCVQCLSDKDCDPDGKSHCDVPKGFCE